MVWYKTEHGLWITAVLFVSMQFLIDARYVPGDDAADWRHIQQPNKSIEELFQVYRADRP